MRVLSKVDRDLIKSIRADVSIVDNAFYYKDIAGVRDEGNFIVKFGYHCKDLDGGRFREVQTRIFNIIKRFCFSDADVASVAILLGIFDKLITKEEGFGLNGEPNAKLKYKCEDLIDKFVIEKDACKLIQFVDNISNCSDNDELLDTITSYSKDYGRRDSHLDFRQLAVLVYNIIDLKNIRDKNSKLYLIINIRYRKKLIHLFGIEAARHIYEMNRLVANELRKRDKNSEQHIVLSKYYCKISNLVRWLDMYKSSKDYYKCFSERSLLNDIHLCSGKDTELLHYIDSITCGSLMQIKI